jgi:heavy metal sensor kinase
MMARTLPIRWRLTIWYVLLLAVILVVFSATLAFGLRLFLHRSLDNTLEDQAALLTESIVLEDGQPAIGDRRIRNRPGQQFVRLVDRDGELLTDSSQLLVDIPMNDPGLAHALNGHTDFRWLDVQGERMRVLSQPVMIDNDVVAVVQVGLTGRSVDSILRQTILLIVAAGAAVLVFSVSGGVWLAKRTLDPIDRITRLAAQIGERDLSQRINLHHQADDEIGRLAGTFNAMLDRLECSFHRRRQFTAAASHELRTPLAVVQSQIELALSHERHPEEDTQVLESLRTDVSRLTRISNTLLALARSDSGEMELTRDAVDLHALLELVAEQYAPMAASLGVEIQVEAEPVRLVGDEDRLIQLLVNLVDNAFQHTPAGKKVRLQCSSTSQHAIVSVIDEGVGIEARHLPYIFERFYRTNASRGRSDGGAGLGLTISKMIVDAHRGSIEVASHPGEGTHVAVKLPNNAGPPMAPRQQS